MALATMKALFERQFEGYASYHTDFRNRLTHFIGIPIIVFAVILALQPAGLALSLGIVFCAIWLAFNLRIGLAMVPFIMAFVWISGLVMAAVGSGPALWLAGGIFVAGWVLQFIGHGFEGKNPAFFDNLAQLLIGPMFITNELLEVFGAGWTREGQADRDQGL